jgi:hypothetical protein
VARAPATRSCAAGDCGSSENRVNATPVMVSTWVCTGRTRVLRGTRLGGRVGETEPGKGGRRRRAVAELCETLRAREGGETEGKRTDDDVHLHAELLRRAGATKRRRSGATAACPSLAAKGGSTARVARARRRQLRDMRSLGHGAAL